MKTSLPEKPLENANKKEKSSLGKKTGLAFFWNIVFLPIKFVLSLFVSLFIVRLFPNEKYVILATIVAIQTSFGMFIDLGIERALPRFVGQVERQLGRGALKRLLVTITLVKLGLLAALIVVITAFAPAFIDWFNLGEQGRFYLALIAILLVLGALYDVFTQILYSFFKQKVTNLLDIVVNVLYPVLTLFLIVWPFQLQVYGVILALLATTIISVVIAGWQAWQASKEAIAEAHQETVKTLDSAASRQLWQRVARYAGLMYFFNLSTWLYEPSFAILIFGFFQAGATVALIKLSYNFIKQLLKTLLTPFVGVQVPLFSAIHAEGNNARLQDAYSSITRLQIFLLIPAATGAMLLSRNLTELLFLSDKADSVVTRANLDLASWASILTIFFTFGESLISVPVTILQVYEQYKLVILARLLPVVMGVGLVVAAWAGWNVVAAVTIMGLMAVGSRFVALVAVRRTLGLYYPLAFLLKVLKASLAFGLPVGLLVFLLPVNWPVTFAASALGAVIFMVVFRKLGGFEQQDKQRLQGMRLPLKKYLLKWL